MMPKWMLTILSILLVIVLLSISASAESWQTWNRNRVNRLRSSHGIRSVVYDSALQSRAQWWANHLAKYHELRHDPNGPSVCWHEGGNHYGQNVGYSTSYPNVERAFEQSSVHRENILGRSYRRLGVGVTHSGERYYLVQDFCG